MATYSTLANVINGTTLTASLYNNIFGDSGNLQYLHDGVVNYFGNCIDVDLKFDILWESTVAASTANSTFAAINYDSITVGSEFNSSNVVNSSLPGCALTSLTPMIFICHFLTRFASNVNNSRAHRLVIGGTDLAANIDVTTHRFTTRALQTANTTDVSSLWISYIIPTTTSATVTFTTTTWQNSGGALNRNYARLAITKLPCA